MSLNQKGLLFNIQRFSLHDGPGIRTSLFFKGCPLSCLWCHNPESINNQPELSFNLRKCIACNRCVEICSSGALQNDLKNGKKYDSLTCERCWLCVEECPANALVLQGKEYTVEEVMNEVLKDLPFYKQSGGGVTLSGGEAAQQFEFCLALLKSCKENQIHTALDTSGCISWNKLKQLLPFVDLVLYDLKHLDNQKHINLTGVSNQIILDNIIKIDKENIPVEIRIPIIPGYNDSEDNLRATANFINRLNNVSSVVLLGYHKLGLSKPWQFDKQRGLLDLESPGKERLEEIKSLFSKIIDQEVIRR